MTAQEFIDKLSTWPEEARQKTLEFHVSGNNGVHLEGKFNLSIGIPLDNGNHFGFILYNVGKDFTSDDHTRISHA